MVETKTVEIPAALVTNVGQACMGVLNSILTGLAGAQLDSVKGNITALLGRKMMTAYDLKFANLVNVPDVVELVLDEDYKVIIDRLKAGIVEGVGATHSGLYEVLAGVSTLSGGYTGIIQRVGIDPFISRYVNLVITPNIPDAETSWYMNKLGVLSDADFKAYAAQNGWDEGFLGALTEVWTSPAPMGMLLDLSRRGLIGSDYLIDQLKRFRVSNVMADALTNLVVQYPEPYRLAEMHSKELISTDDLTKVAGYFGLSSDWALAWSAAQMKYPDVGTAMALLRRGDIDEATFYYWMTRQQIAPEDTEVMLKLKDVIPPIQDLIRFAVREAYGDHSSEVQYPTMVDIAKKMGLTEQASEWYWYAHWDRIPVNLMFANYHRGLWDKTKLERMLKIVDVHPDDRGDIINVAYGPPTVRELGYGWDVGVYTEEDIKRFRRFGGLSPEDADKAAISLVAYRTEGERNSVRTELMYAYGLDKIDEDTLFAELALLNTPAAAIDLWIERAKLYHERIKKPAMDVEGRIVSSAEALAAFKLKIRDETWVREKLKALDWTADRIDVAIERAKVDMAETEAKEAEVKERKLTIAQIRNFYTLHLIGKEEMTVELIKIGYGAEDAEVLTEVYTAEPEVAPQPKAFSSAVASNMYKLMMFDEEDLYNNFLDEGYSDSQAALLTTYTLLTQELPDLQALYVKGVITGEDVVTELIRIEVPEYNARLLVKKITDEYQIERLTQEKNLTKAEIIKGVKNQVLTPAQGASLLVDLGYDEDEAYYILAINKVVAAGDPEGYWEMRRVTESFKKAKGEKYVEIPDEAIMLEKQIKQIKSQIDELKKTGGNEDAIAELLLKLNTLELSMKTLVTEKKLI
jgi:hypothetical protein